PIRRTLPVMAAIPWGVAEAAFRHACGKVAAPKSERILAFLQNARVEAMVRTEGGAKAGLKAGPTYARSTVLDLSSASPLISGHSRHNHDPALTARIDAELQRHGALVGIGRYGEVLPVEDEATVHLGLDFYAPAGTPIHAPLDASVYAV